jgi:chromosome segregation ATPase
MEGVEMSNTNEKYISYYVETLGSTLNDAVLRNISLQANAKMNDEVVQELQKEISFLQQSTEKVESEKIMAYIQREQDLITQFNELKDKHNSLLDNLESSASEKEQGYLNEINSLKGTITMHLSAISELQGQMDAMRQNKSEYDNTKHQLTHLDTFRNELIKAQKELEQYKSSHTDSESIRNKLNEQQNLLIELQQNISQKDKVIDDLKKQIEILQLTPAKKKKASEAKLTERVHTTPVDSVIDALSNVEDGGSF